MSLRLFELGMRMFTLSAAVIVIDGFFFVLDHLTVQLGRQLIYGGVHICGFCISEKLGASDMYGSLRLMIEFFNIENDVHLRDVIIVPFQPL